MIERSWRIGNSRQRLMQALSLLANFLIKPEDDYELIVRPARKEKTHTQRATWHAMLTEFGKELGYTLPEIKLIVKREIFGSRTVKLPNGKQHEIIQSSEDEDRIGYAALIDHTLRIAAENGCLLEIKDRRVA